MYVSVNTNAVGPIWICNTLECEIHVFLQHISFFRGDNGLAVRLVGCFGFNGPLRQYFSLYWAVSQREGERGERIDKSKNVQTTPTRTY